MHMSASPDILPPRRAPWHRAAAPSVYILLLVLGMIGTLVYKLRWEGIFACPASGYGADSYLSDCNAKAYGDYDHGAFWFALEPQAQRAAAQADVLFIGSSRLQYAFSAAPTAEWFSSLRIRHYLLGFSHTETVAFVAPLVAMLRPQAKAYVINVDRFFDDRVSDPAGQILRGGDASSRYSEKRLWQSAHRTLCGAMPLLCGRSLAMYRQRETGAWQLHGSAALVGKDVSVGPAGGSERWPDYAALAEQFVAQLPVERDCILFTLVPTVSAKRAEAAAIANRLGIELIEPPFEGLRTFDGSHLDRASAERWSRAFLEQAAPKIRRCVSQAR